MKQTDTERMRKIVSTWEALLRRIDENGIKREQLLTDEFTQWAVTTPLYNIGEQVYQITEETKKAYPDIPWSFVSGMRHRLVHDYDGINWSIIVEIIYDDMPEFIGSIRRILSDRADQGDRQQ